MLGFGVPLDYKCLSYLVLSTRQEWETAKNVSIYLNQYGTTKAIFSLKDETPTFNLGLRVANSSRDMLNIWKEEREDADSRVEGHWQAVLEKQEEAQELREEIDDLESEKCRREQELASEQTELEKHKRQQRQRQLYEEMRYNVHAQYNRQQRQLYEEMHRTAEPYYDKHSHQVCINNIRKLHAKINGIELELHSKHVDLQNTLRAPPPVIQPLPKNRDLAMPIIFFLYMPRLFQMLSRLSFTAQQLLIPTPWNSNGIEGNEISVVRQARDIGQLSLKDHYNKYQDSQYHCPDRSRQGSDTHLLLRSKSKSDRIPELKTIGNSNVDHIHNMSDGIWYPDHLL